MPRHHKSTLIIVVGLSLTLLFAAEPSHAQWPPFDYSLVASYENGRITYQLDFRDKVDWLMTDVTFKIPLPEGTRFVEAQSIPTVETNFDGAEVTIFLAALGHRIFLGDVSFVIEVTDPTRTVFTTQPWISWEGDQPGSYLPEPVGIDLNRLPLDWAMPPASKLQLTARATVVDELITYYIYLQNTSGRMWDVQVKMPMPEGAVFESAEAPSTFVTNFDGRDVTFSTLELIRNATMEPLIVKVSTAEVTTPFVTTRAWATWKNTGRRVGRSIVVQEEVLTTDIIVQPHVSQSVAVDMKGDVPLPSYDITNLALLEVALPDGDLALKVVFYVDGDLGPVGSARAYHLFIDNDCRVDTGTQRGHVGAEYDVRYRHKQGRADVGVWDSQGKQWIIVERIPSSTIEGNKVVLWVPYRVLSEAQNFCWVAETNDRTHTFDDVPPNDKLPNTRDPRLTTYEALGTVAEVQFEELTRTNEPSDGTFIDIGDTWRFLPGWSGPAPTWNSVNFDDSAWFSGPTTIGYGQGKFATDLERVISFAPDSQTTLVQRVDQQSGMTLAVLPSGNDVDSIFIRRIFNVDDLATLSNLKLEVNYVGGFIAYLNGTEVARQGLGTVGSVVSFDTLATNVEAGGPAEFDLSGYVSSLRAGPNVLAIQAHRPATDVTLAMAPKLTWEHNPAALISDNNALEPAIDPLPGAPVSLSIADLNGKLAAPLDNGRVAYDVYVFSVPDGTQLVKISNARQPNFRHDGQRLLINREGGGLENLYEYDFVDATERPVSDAPQDWHPFYDPWGNRVVYGNAELTVGSAEWVIGDQGLPVLASLRKPFIFVQCGLLPPHQELEPRCRDIPSLGVLVPAGQVGEIQGTHPVWTSNDMIAYRGCNTWAGSALCGIYIVPSASTKGFSNGFIPRQLTQATSDMPSDTKGNLIAFTSQHDGNWEAYIMDINGAGIRNLSNSPLSNDGLPTISPDGNAVAFVSDRDGQWAVWVVSVHGGPAQKLFDLPVEVPWGDRSRVWTNERISWGP